MALYLGSNKVNLASLEKPKLNEIINDTISGVYENSEVMKVKAGAFAYCTQLTNVNFVNCSEIGAQAFVGCKSLVNINFPNCITIGKSAFQSCSALISVDFPSCTAINEGVFENCYALTTASFPNCTSIGVNNLFATSPFYGCSALTTVYAPICNIISASTFSKCYNLISLYLNSVSSVTTLQYDVFKSTPIGGYSASAGRYGSVFVPASLYNDFIVASYWSDIADRIVSI